MAQVIKAFLFAILILATGLPETSHAQSGNRALQEQAAERARQAQAAAAAARDREREAQARRAREQAAANDNRRPSQTSAANDNRRQSNFPNSVPTERLRFEAKPRPGSSFSQPALRPVPPGTTFSSNGVGKPVRPPTAAEARRGFTGRVTEDGRALVKFQGRIYVVPASRIGVRVPQSSANQNSVAAKWSPQKQASIGGEIQKLSAGGTSGGPCDPKQSLTCNFNIQATKPGEAIKFSSPQVLERVNGAQKIRGSGYKYNSIENPGPLAQYSDNPAANFYSGKYNERILQNDVVLYRAGDGKGSPLGKWFTKSPPSSVAQVRIDSAVKPQWIDVNTRELTGFSKIDTVYTIKIPKGTTIYEGPVGNQGGVHVGGFDVEQIYIHNPWEIGGVEVKESKVLK